MTTYTSTDWVTHILRKSSILGEDEAPTAAQLAEGRRIVASRSSFLGVIGVSMWNGSYDEVPEEWFDAGADYMAMFVRQGFGGPPPNREEEQVALRSLRQVASKPATGSTAAAEYY